jgi:hypothetical protein
MSDSVLFLSRPAREGLALIHAGAGERRRAEPVWRLLLTAVFMAGAALTCAVVVIFGSPGGDAGPIKGDPVRMMIRPPVR